MICCCCCSLAVLAQTLDTWGLLPYWHDRSSLVIPCLNRTVRTSPAAFCDAPLSFRMFCQAGHFFILKNIFFWKIYFLKKIIFLKIFKNIFLHWFLKEFLSSRAQFDFLKFFAVPRCARPLRTFCEKLPESTFCATLLTFLPNFHFLQFLNFLKFLKNFEFFHFLQIFSFLHFLKFFSRLYALCDFLSAAISALFPGKPGNAKSPLLRPLENKKWKNKKNIFSKKK